MDGTSWGSWGSFTTALVLGVPAAVYAASRVIRRDRAEDNALAIIERANALVEKDRDYWRDQAFAIEARLMARLDEQDELCKRELTKLQAQIIDLRARISD